MCTKRRIPLYPQYKTKDIPIFCVQNDGYPYIPISLYPQYKTKDIPISCVQNEGYPNSMCTKVGCPVRMASL